MKNYLLIFTCIMVSLFCNSCSKKLGPVVINTTVEIWYKKGNVNLLGPINPNYSINDINLFYVVNGKKTAVFNGKLDAPKGVSLYTDKSNNVNILKIYTNDLTQNNISETIIEIGSGISDTIKCEISKPNQSSRIVTKVWYNSEIKWDVARGVNNEFLDRRLFTVNK